MRLNQQQVHQIVEYIKTVGIDFDAADLEDMDGVAKVLWQYGYFDSWSDEDLEALKQELLPLGLQHELAEVSRMVVVEQEVD